MTYQGHVPVTILLALVAITAVSLSSVFAPAVSASNTTFSTISYTGTGYQKKAPRELESIAVSLIAQKNGLQKDSLEVTNSSVAHYRYSNKDAYLFDLEDRRNGSDYYIWLDINGNQLDEKKLMEEDIAARIAKFGKLSEELSIYITQAPQEEEIPVFVLVNMPPDTDRPQQPAMNSERLKQMSEEEKRAFEKLDEEAEQHLRDYYQERAKRYVEPVAERLRNLGYEVETYGTSSQFFVKLKPAMIKEVESWKEVRLIDRAGKAKPELDVSRQTIGASLVENRNING